MKEFHTFSTENGEYLGSGFADPDPMEKDHWLAPDNSTSARPPEVTDPHTAARYKDGKWSVVPDFRGERYWIDGVEHVIESIDEIVPNGATDDAPPPTLEELRAVAVLDRFDFASETAKAGYVTYAEAAQWAAGNTIPAALQAVIDALPADQQGPVTLDVLARPVIRRTGDLMPALAAAFNTDDSGLDALYGIASG